LLTHVPLTHGFVAAAHSLTSVHAAPGAAWAYPFAQVQTKSPFFEPFGVGSVQPVPCGPQGFVAQSSVFATQTPPTTMSGGTAVAHVHCLPFWQPAPVVHVAQAVDREPQAFPVVVQTPAALHLPPAAQASRPCVHAALTFAACATHAPPEQTPVWHWSVFEEQSIGVLTHRPLAQTSVVQGLLSLQPAFTPFEFVCWHPSLTSQVSVVQALLSSQALPTLVMSMAVWAHPVALSQVSMVQASVSEQSTGLPGSHLPLKHVACCVHLSPVSQPGSIVPVAFCPYTQVSPFWQTVPSSCSHAAGLSHATLQHAPPTQLPEAQSVPFLHAWALSFRHLSPTRVLPFGQPPPSEPPLAASPCAPALPPEIGRAHV